MYLLPLLLLGALATATSAKPHDFLPQGDLAERNLQLQDATSHIKERRGTNINPDAKMNKKLWDHFTILKTRTDTQDEDISVLKITTSNLDDRLKALEDAFVVPATPSQPLPERSETMTPCEDSHFDIDAAYITGPICEKTVEYRMCMSQFLAYHCCRSCTDAGQIAEDGPHRYLNYPRNVTSTNSEETVTPSTTDSPQED